jgi:hypothetical protein
MAHGVNGAAEVREQCRCYPPNAGCDGAVNLDHGSEVGRADWIVTTDVGKLRDGCVVPKPVPGTRQKPAHLLDSIICRGAKSFMLWHSSDLKVVG